MSQTKAQLVNAVDGSIVDADIVGLTSSKLSGALPAISGASLTNLPAAGKFASYAIICDQKATDANGGSSSTGQFYVRDLNTELADPDGIVSISSNQFTLQAGTYLLKASAPAQGAGRHQIIINNATDSAVAVLGMNAYSNTSSVTTSRAFATGRVTIGSAKVFEIRHRVEDARSTDGLGVACNFDLLLSIYTVVEIYKET